MQIPRPDSSVSNRSWNENDFEEMFRTWYNPLCNYACSFLSDKDEAEEVVQSVFIHLWEKKREIEFEVSHKAYLYRSVRNASLNRLKHEKVKKQHVAFVMADSAGAHSFADNHAESELTDRIDKALKKLPEQCGVVFRLSRFEELKYAEIATQLGISIKTVENQMGKALKIMRDELKEYLVLIAIMLNGCL